MAKRRKAAALCPLRDKDRGRAGQRKVMWSSNPNPGHISRQNKFKKICAPLFIAVLFTVARHGNDLSVCPQISGQKRCIYTQRNSSHKKEWDNAICRKLGGPRGYLDRPKVQKWKSHSVMSDSLQPHGLQPTRLPCPWNSPGKNAGVGSHSLL